MSSHLSVDVLGIPPPRLSTSEQLAEAVLAGDFDAVWPLIDSILEARDRPDLPTCGELLNALRVHAAAVKIDRAGKGAFSDKELLHASDQRIIDLVARCEGVAT